MGRIRHEKGEKKGPGRKARKQAAPDFSQLFDKKVQRDGKRRNKKVQEEQLEADEGLDDFEPFDDQENGGAEEEFEDDDEQDDRNGHASDDEQMQLDEPRAKNGTKPVAKNGGLMINITQSEPKQRPAKASTGKLQKEGEKLQPAQNGAAKRKDLPIGVPLPPPPQEEGSDAEADDSAEEDEDGAGERKKGGSGVVTDLKVLQARIKKVGAILSNFSKRREADRSRHSYTEELCSSLATYYGYNPFLIRKFYDLFPNDIVEFLEANEHDRPLTIRTNTLKTKRRDLMAALQRRGVQVEAVGDWTKVGLVVYDSHVPIGATPEYLAGHYVLQGASSWLPVMALAPQLGERVLDMCSAPGGKTSHIAAVLRNGGLLMANDANRDRLKAVVGNLHRLGVNNAVVSSRDGCELGRSMPNAFDRVLLDAPCSGSGVIAKDASVKSSKTETDVRRCSTLQKKLLLAAIDACNARSPTGGYVVYSTCSVFVEEDEAVIQYALRKRFVKIVDSGVELGHEGFTKFLQYRFNQRMRLARRVYPHAHNMDGFFFCKLKKLADGVRVDPEEAKAKTQEHVEANQNEDADKDDDAAEDQKEKKQKNKKKQGSKPNGKSNTKRKVKANRDGKTGKKLKLLKNTKPLKIRTKSS